MDLRLTIAILTGKILSFILKLSGSGATAAPGLYALKIDPNLITKLSKKIKEGSIVVSGTNGKTTTSRLIGHLLGQNFDIIHNRQGSNLERGIASTFIAKSSAFGNILETLALWEADEAVLPEIIAKTKPKIVVFLNLFRDQLDRYGEVNTTRQKWARALKKLSTSSILILNADDPGINILAKNFKGKILSFGVEDEIVNLPAVKSVSDVSRCPNCGFMLKFAAVLSAHLGHYNCTKCSFKRETPQVSASKLRFSEDFSTKAQFSILNSQFSISYPLPGLFNVYNILAALSVTTLFNIDQKTILKTLTNFSTAFGRFQSAQINDKSVVIFLIKNPAGTNEVLRTLALKNKINLLTFLNDKIADGRDVSWIWDTNWEILSSRVKKASVGGSRRWDIATRLKYANFRLSKYNVYEKIDYSIINSINKLNNNDTLVILATYTALLETQKAIYKLSKGTKWHKQ